MKRTLESEPTTHPTFFPIHLAPDDREQRTRVDDDFDLAGVTAGRRLGG